MRAMPGLSSDLFAATLAFVLGHFLLSSQALRRPLTERLGERGFRGFYVVFVLAAFVWMLISYGHAFFVPVWLPPDWTRWIPILVMPFASILAVGGLTQPSPTLVGGEATLDPEAPLSPARGFLSITRHPFLWGAALWALSHLAANGDAASMVMMGGILVLSLGGMAHIDHRRAQTLGSTWGPIALTTSLVPFVAVIQGRCRLDWAGIGWWRPLAGLLLYAVLLFGHRFIAGVPVLM